MGRCRCKGEKLFIPLSGHRATKTGTTKTLRVKHTNYNNKNANASVRRYFHQRLSYRIRKILFFRKQKKIEPLDHFQADLDENYIKSRLRGPRG